MNRKKHAATIVEAHAKNFDTIQKAFANGDMCLLDCQIRDTGESVAALCSLNADGTFTPFAMMFNGNPYEILNPPDPAGGYFQEGQ